MSSVLLSLLLGCNGETQPPVAPTPPPEPPKPAFEPKHAALFGVVPDDFRDNGKDGKAGKGKADGDGKAGKGDKADDGKAGKGDKAKGDKADEGKAGKGKAGGDDDDAADRSEARIALGRMLYWDPRLSASNEVSCNSCHKLLDFGADGLPKSPGHDGKDGARNSPTVYNAGGNFVQFWDGRAENLFEQAKGPVLNPVEMGMLNGDEVAKKVAGLEGYPDRFKDAFPNDASPVTFDNIARAIASFEKGLATTGSTYDKYLKGQEDALSPEQLEGYDLFVETGCATCHNGPLFGGQMYQRLGLVKAWETADTGRFEVTKAESDKYFFKVPSLRNVAKTGPYLHDGSIASLDQMVKKMAEHQLGKDLGPVQVNKIVAFLDSLTGELPRDYVKRPDIPGLPDMPSKVKGKAKGDGEGDGKAGKGKKGG